MFLFFHLCIVVISQVKGQLQIGEERVGKLRIHIQNLQQLFSLDRVQVTVAQSSHVCIRFTGFGVQVNHLSKYVILT